MQISILILNKIWLLPKQELLMPKHIDCCRLFETMLSQFI
jgi:hypothetical protein